MALVRRVIGLLAVFLFIGLSQSGDHPVLSGRIMDMAKQVDKTCREESGSDRDSFRKYIHGIIDEANNFKCYIRCIMVQFDSLSEDGVFILEEELKNVPPEIIEEGHRIVHNCKHLSGADSCDTAFLIHKCYNDSNPELYKHALMQFDMTIES